MTFTSIAFAVFFLLMIVGCWLCPPRFRWALLLLGSCYFYAAFVPMYIFVLFFLILADFILAQRIECSQGHRRRVYFILSIVANVGVLFVFKYFNFFNANIFALATLLHWHYSIGALRLLLPLGLSFHTFQSISYVIEVYRGKYLAERHLGVYALYVMFFPQLIAGPIERPAHLLPQLRIITMGGGAQILSGLRLMAWGFFKKLVIADRLARVVDHVYGQVPHMPGPSIAVAFVFFAFQLYADFSGYSDIARGSARVFGIELVRNFEQPYFSRSIAEFWRRWHMSLSSWFREYLYFPLAFAGRGNAFVRVYASVFVTFLLMGFWHGAAWTFILMGAFFGSCIVLGLLTKSLRQKVVLMLGLGRVPHVHSFMQGIMTFVLVCVGWVFFRAPNVHTALLFLSRLWVGWDLSPAQFFERYYLHPLITLGISRSELLLSVGSIVLLLSLEYVQTLRLDVMLQGRSVFVRSFAYSSLVLAIVLFGMFSVNPFIYFQF